MTYEEAIKELEEIVETLEKENLPLKQCQDLFSRAGVLAKFAQEELAKTNGKLFEIKKQLDEIVEEQQ